MAELRAFFLFFIFLGATACAKAPTQGIPDPATFNAPGYGWPPGEERSEQWVAQRAAQAQGSRGAKTIRSGSKGRSSSRAAPYITRTGTPAPIAAPMMGQKQCLKDLKKLGVRFTQLDRLKGVEVPIELEDGRLGGVEFWLHGNAKMRLDCRLALALQRLAPIFKKHNVSRARYSGAYSYRRTRSGRLSHHAYGLAIDIHELTIAGRDYKVDHDFGRNEGCPASSRLNQLSCALKFSNTFKEFLTPDYNADHRDHLHVSVPKKK